MDETIGWLLPLLLATSLAKAVCSAADQRRVRTICLIAMGVLVTGMSIGLIRHPTIRWVGPTLFELDTSHRLSVSLRLTWTLLPLSWLAWWWMADESPDAAGCSQYERRLRQAALSCLLLMFVSDNLWLWYGALVAFSLLQQSLIKREISQDYRWTALRGGHWLGVLLLLISIGILSFDFRWQTFSDVLKVFEEWDGFSDIQQAELTLATTLAAWSVLLTAAVFPFSVLRIDRDDESHFEILSAAVAGAICVQFAPLLSILDVTAAHRPLLLLTLLTATVCSWQQPTARRVTRCLGMALIMLSLMGLLIARIDGPGQLTRALSLEHFALALILWKLWADERYDRHSKIVTSGFAVLLLAGFSSCLLSLSARAGGSLSPGRLDLFLAAGLSLGLTTLIWRSLFQKPEDKQQEPSSRSSAESFISGFRLRLACLVGFAVIATTRVMLWNTGLTSVAFPSLEVLGALLAGAVTAILWERRTSRSPDVLRTPGTLSRLLDSQFHLVSIWQGMIQVPGIVLTTACRLWGIQRLRSPVKAARQQGSAANDVPFVWELGLGLASLFVLSSLFLWMGE
jgi:hypothetical protein